MAHDFLVEGDLTFGEWLRGEIEDVAFMERDGFFVEQVARVADQLQADREGTERLEVLIPWIRLPTAFTAPGRYIYLSRRLLERCPSDEAVAFVVAHEIAHHDLRHLAVFRRLSRRVRTLGAGGVAILLFRHLQKRVYGPEWECDADRRAVELCVRAGYDGYRCLHLFKVLEHFALDRGDLDAVYGLEEDSDEELSPDADFMTKARIWAWQRRRGYLPIQDRAAAARRHLESLEGTAA